MRKTPWVIIAAVVAALGFGVAAAAASGGGSWWHHTLGNGNVVCNQDDSSNPSPVDGGPFDTKAACEASTPTGGGGGSGGPIPGWPATTGTPAGTFQCAPDGIILTSADDENGFGAYDFGATGGTFAQMGDGGAFTVLAGSVGAGSPRISVFLANGDEWFVYLYDVNGPGTRYEDATHNPGVYITWAQAMAIDGTQNVTDAILVVDNGDLSIDAQGLVCGGNAATLATLPPPDSMFLCYSTFETDGGQVFTNAQALALLADPKSGFWAPSAVAGTDTTGATPNISGYHLVCNPPASLKPTGTWLYADNNGAAEIAPFGPLVAGSAGYAIVK